MPLAGTSRCMEIEAAPSETMLQDLRLLMVNNPVLGRQSTYCQIRRSIVNWVADVSKELGLKPMTVHCATCFLDRYMHTSKLSEIFRLAKYHAFAAAAILIAAKLEEHAERVPLISEMLQAQSSSMALKDVSAAELQILKCLQWKTSVCTTLHFLDIHLHQGICSQGDHLSPRTEKVQQDLVKYMYFYADLCLLQTDFSEYPTALTSAAIIATARQTVRISPSWTPQLHARTGYSGEELEPCVNLIKNEFCRTWPEAAPGHLQTLQQLNISSDSSRSESSGSATSLSSRSTGSGQMMINTIGPGIWTRQGIEAYDNGCPDQNPWNGDKEGSMEICPDVGRPPVVPSRRENLKIGQLLLL